MGVLTRRDYGNTHPVKYLRNCSRAAREELQRLALASSLHRWVLGHSACSLVWPYPEIGGSQSVGCTVSLFRFRSFFMIHFSIDSSGSASALLFKSSIFTSEGRGGRFFSKRMKHRELLMAAFCTRFCW